MISNFQSEKDIKKWKEHFSIHIGFRRKSW